MIASTQTNHPLVGAAPALAAQSPMALACTHLKSSGLRITQPRIAILSALIKRGQPSSIEQIHGDLDAKSCDLVTVYRCLAAFEEIGLVRRSFYHNGTSLYALSIGAAKSYHFVCKETNQVEEIDAELTAEIRRCAQQIEELLKARGYSDVSHMLQFFGRSPQAQASRATNVAPPVPQERSTP